MRKPWKASRGSTFLDGLCFSSCFQLPALHSCPEFPQWWDEMWKYKASNPLPLPCWLWPLFYHINQKLTRRVRWPNKEQPMLPSPLIGIPSPGCGRTEPTPTCCLITYTQTHVLAYVTFYIHNKWLSRLWHSFKSPHCERSIIFLKLYIESTSSTNNWLIISLKFRWWWGRG